MVLLSALGLFFNEIADRRRQILLERFAVTGHGRILAALAFVEHGLVAVPAQHTAHRHPPTVQRTGHRSAFIRLAAKLTNQRLQFLAGGPAFAGVAHQQTFQVGGLGMFGRNAESEFAIAAGFKQRVEGADYIVVAGCHGRAPSNKD